MVTTRHLERSHRLRRRRLALLIAVSDLFGVTGRQRLAKVPLGPAYAERVRSLLELIDILDGHEARFAAMIAERLRAHRGYQAIQQVPGIGPVLAAVFVAEIGDAHRFPGPAQLTCWAGTNALPPRIRHHGAPEKPPTSTPPDVHSPGSPTTSVAFHPPPSRECSIGKALPFRPVLLVARLRDLPRQVAPPAAPASPRSRPTYAAAPWIAQPS